MLKSGREEVEAGRLQTVGALELDAATTGNVGLQIVSTRGKRWEGAAVQTPLLRQQEHFDIDARLGNIVGSEQAADATGRTLAHAVRGSFRG